MRRRRSSRPSLTESDDLIWEILLRLSPQPSSLPRASAVCKQWRRLATDPEFLRSFYAHHRKPPLLGVFEYGENKMVFRSIMDSPDHIAPERFDLGLCSVRSGNDVFGCWQGRVLARDNVLEEVVVCAPLTGEQRRVAIPAELQRGLLNGAVLCAATDQGHVHGACHSSPFKVVLVSMLRKQNKLIARVYSSETGVWGNLVSITITRQLFHTRIRAILVGDALYWLLLPRRDGILKFNLEEESLSLIPGPPAKERCYHHQIIQAEDGVIGFALLYYPRLQMWQRNVNSHGVQTWVSWKTIDLHNILGLPHIERRMRGMETILGYSEDIDVIFLSVGDSVYAVQLKSMESKRLYKSCYISDYHPFTSFYAPGATIARGCTGAKMLHNA